MSRGNGVPLFMTLPSRNLISNLTNNLNLLYSWFKYAGSRFNCATVDTYRTREFTHYAVFAVTFSIVMADFGLTMAPLRRVSYR